MSKRVFSDAFFLLIALTCAAGWAAGEVSDSLTLDQAIFEALGDSPAVVQANALQKEASWKSFGSFSGVLPKVSLFATHSFDTKYETLPFSAGPINAEVPIAFPRTSYGLDMHWVLFDGFANWNRVGAARLDEKAADAASDRKHFEVRKHVELQYFAVLAAIQLQEVAIRNLKTIQDNLAIAQSRVRNGVSTAPDVLRVQVQETDAQAEVQRTADAIIIQRQKLREVMGLARDERNLNGKLPEPTQGPEISSLQFEGIDQRDDIKALQLHRQASEKESAAGYGELFPSVSLVGRLENYDNTDYSLNGSRGNYRAAYDVGVALKWDILDAATIAKPGLAAARKEYAESKYQEAVLNAPTEFELWKRRYVYSANLYQARKDDIKRADESLRIITLSFQQGRRIINEVLDAEVDLFRARAGAVQSQFEATEARNQLELALGKDLK